MPGPRGSVCYWSFFLTLLVVFGWKPVVQGWVTHPEPPRRSSTATLWYDGAKPSGSFTVQKDDSTTKQHPHVGKNTTAVPNLYCVSQCPWIWMSNEPLVTRSECRQLETYFRHQTSNGTTEKNGANGDTFPPPPQSFWTLTATLDSMLDRNADPPVWPRFLEYEAQESTHWHARQLLEDGLHVDTNNGLYFRYLTVLLYLTNAQSSATTFPLANTPKINTTNHNYNIHSRAHTAARQLVDANVLHTRAQDTTIDNVAASDCLEELAWLQYCHGNKNNNDYGGVRILPRQGHILVFAGVEQSGKAHPSSFHGAETLLYPDKKTVLSFFYEVPVELFDCRAEFGRVAAQRIQALVDKYGVGGGGRANTM